jgi:hypothetical protein
MKEVLDLTPPPSLSLSLSFKDQLNAAITNPSTYTENWCDALV